jgi:hypothetical protein
MSIWTKLFGGTKANPTPQKREPTPPPASAAPKPAQPAPSAFQGVHDIVDQHHAKMAELHQQQAGQYAMLAEKWRAEKQERERQSVPKEPTQAAPPPKPPEDVPAWKLAMNDYQKAQGSANKPAKPIIETQLMIQGNGNTRGSDTEADKRSIIDALNVVAERYSLDIEPKNIRLQFFASPDEPNSFMLTVNVTTTEDKVLQVQQSLVETLGSMGIKV